MQPDHNVTRTNFGVDGLTFGVAVNASLGETKRLNKKIMSGCNVLVHKDWNDSLDLRHIASCCFINLNGSPTRWWPSARLESLFG